MNPYNDAKEVSLLQVSARCNRIRSKRDTVHLCKMLYLYDQGSDFSSHSFKAVADLRGRQGRAPTGGPNSFIIMQFLAKNQENNRFLGVGVILGK